MASLPQRDMHWVSWPGVCTCVVGGVLYLFSCVQNKQASQLEAAVPLDKLSGAPPAARNLRALMLLYCVWCVVLHMPLYVLVCLNIYSASTAAQLQCIKQCPVCGRADLKSLAKLVPFLASVTARTWTDSPLKCALTDRGAVISDVISPPVYPLPTEAPAVHRRLLPVLVMCK